jgi:hypothetical protein
MAKNFTISGNVSNSNVNMDSRLSNVAQTISGIPGASEKDKITLTELMEKLKSELDKVPKLAPDQVEAAEKIALRAKQLVEEASVAKPEKEEVEDKANKLKKAAENVKGTLPAVFSIVEQITSFFSKVITNS